MGDSYRKFDLIDAIAWKSLSAIGYGDQYLNYFKYAWIQHNEQNIKTEAANNNIPPLLLAGVALAEVGGKDFTDWPVFSIRSFIWKGPSWTTVTKNPAFTSMGAVSIQLRRAAQTMGKDPSTLTQHELHSLATALQVDVINLNIVAKHLYQLILIDYPKNFNTNNLSDEQIKVVGTRYYLGPEESTESVKRKALISDSYGSKILQNKEFLLWLLR